MSHAVLVLNCGSSSVKYALIEPQSGSRYLTGLAERVGTPEVTISLSIEGPDGVEKQQLGDIPSTDHSGVITRILTGIESWLAENGVEIAAVGHRMVHGGEAFSASAVIDGPTLDAIRACVPLAPLHNPANIQGLEAAEAMLPGVPHVAVFDTAFHQSMPEVAFRYAVPEEWYADYGVRRYGFHGTSHRYVSAKAAELLDRPLSELRMVTAHLGNGCSLAAIKDGVSVDTSMGLTPLEGVVMGTRSGDLDPGIMGYLADRTGATAAEITGDLNRRSGLLGLSGGLSNDMRELWAAAKEGHEGARRALDVFVYRLAKYIASLAVAAGGLDVLVFTGGIGENDAAVRALVLEKLAFLGFEVDAEANDAARRGAAGIITRTTDTDTDTDTNTDADAGPIARPFAGPFAVVVPTDEELVIAQDAAAAAGLPLGS